MINTKQTHIATVLLHDYFHRGVFHDVISNKQWNRLESRLEKNVDDVLRLFSQYHVTATFFALGWLAEKKPELIKRIVDQGHEIASAGYSVKSVRDMTPEEFKADLRHAQEALEAAGANHILGYRCAYKWFSKKDEWALDLLAKEGYIYDASYRPQLWSIRPKDKDRCLYQCGDEQKIWELPVSTTRLLGANLPISGGSYFRHFSHEFMFRQFIKWQEKNDSPFILYFHPWELDDEQPRINAVSSLARFKQYRNLGEMANFLPRYFESGVFTSAAQYFDHPLTFPKILSEQKTEGAKLHVSSAQKKKVSLVVPCFNEESSLVYLANSLKELEEDKRNKYKFQFIFVDDCSTDNTLSLLNKQYGQRSDCRVIKHETNQGVAAAIQTGIRAADYDIICSIDADCTYDPLLLLDMIPMLESNVDMVVASPYHKDGKVLNVPSWRLFLSKSLSNLYHLILNNKLATYTACFRVYRRESVINIDIDHSNFIGVIELLAKLDIKRGRILEFPTVLQSRLLGYSKMKVIRTIFGHFKLLLSMMKYRKKVRGSFFSLKSIKTVFASFNLPVSF